MFPPLHNMTHCILRRFTTLFLLGEQQEVSSLLALFPKSLSCHLATPQREPHDRELQEAFAHCLCRNRWKHLDKQVHCSQMVVHYSYMCKLYPWGSCCTCCVFPRRCESANGMNFLCVCVCRQSEEGLSRQEITLNTADKQIHKWFGLLTFLFCCKLDFFCDDATRLW